MAFDGGLARGGHDATLASIVAETTIVASEIGALQARHLTALATALDLAEARAAGAPERVRARDLAVRDVSAEIGGALRVSDRSMQRQLSEAWEVVNRFPATHRALGEGRISIAHVRTIVDVGAPIDDDTDRSAFETAAIRIAESESAGRLTRLIAPLAEEVRAVSLDERHRTARRDRRVMVNDLADGMSEVCAIVPSILAHGIADRLARMARAVKHEPESHETPGPADTRTTAQIQADILCDVLLGGAPVASGDGLAAITPIVQVTIPVLALTGHTDNGATLAGLGPIDADTARHLAGTATGWDRVMTHPITGTVLAVDRYRPSNDLKRALRVRDEHCRFPGCRTPAHRSDIDHTHDAARGGATSIDNLAHLCRRHHTLKHDTRWAVTHHPGGVLTWTSPLGTEYTDTPPRHVSFAPEPCVSDAPF